MLINIYNYLQLYSFKYNNVLKFLYFFIIKFILIDKKFFEMCVVNLKKAKMFFFRIFLRLSLRIVFDVVLLNF